MPTGLPLRRKATPAPETDNSWVVVIVVLLGTVLLAIIGWILHRYQQCRLYHHHQGRGENDKIGHERYYQRPVVTYSRKHKKRLYNHRKARSVSQIDSSVLATANANVFNQQSRVPITTPPEGADSNRRCRPPLLRHTSTSLDDLTQLKRHLQRPSLVNEEDNEDEVDTEDINSSAVGLFNGKKQLTCCVERPLAVTVTTPPVSNGSPLSSSLESLAKFFSGVFVNSRRSFSTASGNTGRKSSTLPSIRRHYARYDYTALEDDQSVPAEKLEMEKKHHRGTARGNALLTCQYYLRTSGRYTYVEQLNDIGSRIDKYWFMVRDTNLKTDRMLTMVPYSEYSPISFNGSTKDVLTDLFLALQHPYIYPILDVDFKTMAEETFVINIYPFNCHGSLKDLIYRSICRDDWQEKYGHRSVGLPEPQIQRIGRQILEALLFLRDKGFPPFGHLHSGNVIMQNGVARLTGFENTLLGYTSRIYPILRKRLRDCKDAIDTICFGHVLFEMAAAYELNVVHPTTKHLQDVQSCPQILQVLNFIFEREDTIYPTIEEISLLDFFRNLDLREMRGAASPAKLSPAVRCLLKDVRRHQKCQKTSKRSHSTSSLETPRESKSFPGSDILDNKEGVGIHRNLSASYAASSNCLVVLENGDVRHQAQMMSTTDSTKSTPYCSLLDVSGHLIPSGSGEEYHTPPTTPTIKSELDLTNHNDNNHHQIHELAMLAPSSLLQHCFQKIQNTFEAVHKASHSNRDSII